MTAPSAKLTMQEAEFVLGRPRTILDRAIDRGEIVRATSVKGGKARSKARLLGRAELRYLKLEADLHKVLTPAGRKQIYRAIKRLPKDSHRLVIGDISMEFGSVDQALALRLERLSALKNAVVENKGGERLLRDTGIPVYMVAGLARTLSIDEILGDYPSLSADQVRTAVDYARVYPKAGRPYPDTTLKRAISGLASGGAFDIEPDEPVTIQMFK